MLLRYEAMVAGTKVAADGGVDSVWSTELLDWWLEQCVW